MGQNFCTFSVGCRNGKSVLRCGKTSVFLMGFLSVSPKVIPFNAYVPIAKFSFKGATGGVNLFGAAM